VERFQVPRSQFLELGTRNSELRTRERKPSNLPLPLFTPAAAYGFIGNGAFRITSSTVL
jgi:hypothetical protein